MRTRPSLVPLAVTVIAFGCDHESKVATPEQVHANAASEPAASSAPIASAAPIASGAAPTASASATVPPSPIDGTLPNSATLGLSTKASCPAKQCRLEGTLLDAILDGTDKASPAAIWEEGIGEGAVVSVPRRTDADLLGVVLAGEIVLGTDEKKETRAPLVPWTAFVAPGAGVTLTAKSAARVVLVLATSGDPIVRSTSAHAWTERPRAVAVVNLEKEADLAWGKGAYHARIGFASDASPRASLGILKMSPEGAVAAHQHDNEWEHMSILQGDGDFLIGTGANEHTTRASDGLVVSVPKATRHQWQPARKRPFLGIQVYTPPGPEQRFKKLAQP